MNIKNIIKNLLLIFTISLLISCGESGGGSDGTVNNNGSQNETEPNDALEEGNTVLLGSVSGNLDTSNDKFDYFLFTVPSDGTYRFAVTTPSGADLLNLRLKDVANTSVILIEGGVGEDLDFGFEASKVIMVRVRADDIARDNNEGSYQITISKLSSDIQDNTIQLTDEEYLDSLPATACERDNLDGAYYLDTEYVIFFPKATVPVNALFEFGALKEFNGASCAVVQSTDFGDVKDTACPDCEVLWDCGGCWIKQEISTSLFGSHKWTLKPFSSNGCPEDISIKYMVESVASSSCFYTDSDYCLNDSYCAINEICKNDHCQASTSSGGGSSSTSCSDCISSCSGLGIPSCCTGTGCICESDCR